MLGRAGGVLPPLEPSPACFQAPDAREKERSCPYELAFRAWSRARSPAHRGATTGRTAIRLLRARGPRGPWPRWALLARQQDVAREEVATERPRWASGPSY